MPSKGPLRKKQFMIYRYEGKGSLRGDFRRVRVGYFADPSVEWACLQQAAYLQP